MPAAIPLDYFNRQIFRYAVPGPFRPKGRYWPLTDEQKEIVRRFHQLSYDLWQDGRESHSVSWLGYLAYKSPLDLWAYQEIIVETTPDLIIECGTRFGGSALYLASICQMVGRGAVISIDIDEQPDRPVHGMLRYINASSTEAATIDEVCRHIDADSRVMVILDSDHHHDHVLAEMRLYGPLVTPGCYMIVEDGNVNGHPVLPEHGPGPTEALATYLAENPPFEVDEGRERFLLTQNPGGYLRRI